MRVTIIKDDNAVYLDGSSRRVDCSMLPSDFHALQWYGTWGEIEFVTDVSQAPPQRKPNQVIRDLEPYQALIDAWKGATS